MTRKASRKISKWARGLSRWTLDVESSSDATEEEKDYARGVRFFMSFVFGQVGYIGEDFGRPGSRWPPSFRAGYGDASYVYAKACATDVVPSDGFSDVLQSGHAERTAEAIRNPDLDALYGLAIASLEAVPGLTDEERQRYREQLENPPTAIPDEGLSEQKFGEEMRAWAKNRLSQVNLDSFEREYLRGLILATDVRDGTAAPLGIDFASQPNGPWNGHSAGFMSGYCSTMMRRGIQSFFTQFAFDPEREEFSLGLMRRVNGA